MALQQDASIFISTRRDRSKPWRNFLSNGVYNAYIDHLGAGQSYGRCAYNDRITADDSPRVIYLHDHASHRYWTVNGVPGRTQPADWECHHGYNQTTITSTCQGICTEATFFVPSDEPVEVWIVRLTNLTKRHRSLSTFTHVKWQLGFLHTPITCQNVYARNGVIYAESLFWPGEACRSTFPEFNREWDRIAFFASNVQPAGFDCLPEQFIGAGAADSPDVVKRGRCTSLSGRGGEGIAVLQHRVRLRAGQSSAIVMLTGSVSNRREIARLLRKFASEEHARKSLATMQQDWDRYRNRMTIQLPDHELTHFANGWNRIGIQWRYRTRFGYRDTAQDIVAMFPFDREQGRARLIELFRAQLSSGQTMHDVATFRARQHVTINSDPPLWMPWATAEYLKETGDFGFLKERFPYFDGGAGTAYEHMVRAIEWVLKQRGRFGLPLLKCGDWNDALSGASHRGVSVWLAQFLHVNLREMVEISRRMGMHSNTKRFARIASSLGRAINERCWDGKWYLCGFDDEGKPIGARRNRQGRIYVNAQTWAILAGIAPADRARKSLDAVRELMDTPVGIPMLAPPYLKPDASIGEITRYTPGHHHNGGVWNHVNAWVVLAECLCGRTDRALEVYRRIFPPRLAREVRGFDAPPYAYGSWTNTPLSREPGKADCGCNTGTTCWMYRALFKGFLGIHAEFDGLRIDPRMPTSWKWARTKRPFRKNIYHIEIQNPEGVASGIRRIELDGKRLEGNVIPDDGMEGKHSVLVIMGRC